MRDDDHANLAQAARSEPANATMSDRRSMREAPGYEIWFGLSEDRVWKLGGVVAAAFVGLVTVGVLGAIVVAVAS